MTVTLKTIAERSGLSQSTVSQILNRKSNDFSSEKTRQMVFQLAQDMGYKQKFGHKILRGDKTHTVAILLGMHRIVLEEHIQALIMRLLDLLENKGYGSYLVTLNESAEKNLETIRELTNRGTECFILLGCPTGTTEMEQYILEQKRTFIGYNTTMSRNMQSDISESITEIIRYFLSAGHSNFRFFLGTPPHCGRMEGLRKVFPDQTEEELLAKYWIDLGTLGEHDDIDTYAEIGYRTTRDAFEHDPGINGCIYLSDYFAVGGLRYLLETGRQVGKDVFVAGFNNIHAIRTYPFPVSSVEHNIPRIAESLIAAMEENGPLERMIPARTLIRK